MGLRLITRERCWTLACQLAFLGIVLSVSISRGYVLTAIGDITQCLLLTLALLCIIPNIKTSERRTQLFWYLMALGVGLWLGAQVLWTYFEVFLRREVPNPFVGDVILFLHLVPMMGAIAVQPHLERQSPVSRLGAIDFVLLFLWWLYLYSFVVIPWQYVRPDAWLYGRSFDALYLAEHLVLLACTAIAWAGSRDGWKSAYRHLFGAGMLYALASVSAGIAIDFGRYYTGSLFDAPLVLSMVWFAALGMAPAKQPLRAEPATAGWEKHDTWVSGAAMITILSLPVMLGWSFYFSTAPASVRSFRLVMTLLTMLVMGALIWLKQYRLDRELSRITQELREDSLTDLLTGARNRRFLNSTIEGDVRQAIRAYAASSSSANSENTHNRDLAFYLIDIDGFKAVNDRYGHAVGDNLLVEIARRISSAIRHSDVLIRWGGDEFLVVSRYTARAEAAVLASRVLQAVGDKPCQPTPGLRVSCTCSMGWSVFPWLTAEPDQVSYEEVLQLADSALYEAKNQGRNRAIGMLPASEEISSSPYTKLAEERALLHHLQPEIAITLGPVIETDFPPHVLAQAAFLGS